nr:immunoglobulin heavy chain junction region [Mus musculus]MBK4186170.1 immunoglobulin heavy chain junction region [Mus musculus]
CARNGDNYYGSSHFDYW